MNRRISKKVEQNSIELSLNNGIVNSQSNWSRCNSYSSSSNDSTLYCSTSPQRSSFPGRKRLKTDESVAKIVKRSRNSSGSSASSNLSCLSDKDTRRMPTLISPEQVNNIETLADMSPSTLALQHEALINSRLSHSLDMNAVLPFRHNLRRNIRRKTCSCDCTATCTTVVVSRQYKGVGEQTVEEKTVISHTKVKTFVESSQTPARGVQLSSKMSFQENVAQNNESSFQNDMSNKNEGNRRRRSEIEKLYDSLHEITWAKNFSPDNILRQFDVRQAASCSVFGKSSSKNENKANNSSTVNCTKLPNKSANIKVSKSNSTKHNNVNTPRSRSRSSFRNSKNKLKEDNSHPPVLEKSILTVDEALHIDPPHYNTYPVLSKEVVTPVKKSNTNSSVDFLSSCNTIETSLNNLSKTTLNLDLNPNCNIDSQIATLTASTFFDFAEDNIHTIDACFREVGAEVVVSTCCDTNCNNLPLLTAVKEIHSSNIRSISNDCPPVLEQCDLSFDASLDDSLKHNSNASDSLCHKPIESFKTFFPRINPQLIPDEDYFPPLNLLKVYGKNALNYDEDIGENTDKMNCLSDDSDKSNVENADDLNCLTDKSDKETADITDDEINNIIEDYNEYVLENIGKKNNLNENNYKISSGELDDRLHSATEDNDKNFIETNDEINLATEDNKIYAVEHIERNGEDENVEMNYSIESLYDSDTKMVVNNDTNLPNLMSGDKSKTLVQNVILEPDPPILEPCISNDVCNVENEPEIFNAENIKKENKDFQEKNYKSSGELANRANCNINETNNSSIKSKKLYQKYKSLKNRLKSHRLYSGKGVLKKYVRFINSKSKRQNYLSKVTNASSKSSVLSHKTSSVSDSLCNVEKLVNDSLLSVIPLSLSDCAQMPPSLKIINSYTTSQSSPSQIITNCISSSASCLQSTSTVTNAKSSTVIQSFNQKLSYSTTEENITLNQVKNSSFMIQAEKKPCFNNKKAKKSLLNNAFSENFADMPGYAKILSAAKKKEESDQEKVKVPPRVFTCHFQTINVTRGNDYIQIVLKITRGKSIFLTHETLVELKEAIIKAGNDKDCRLLILNGFGQTFCLGLDLRPLVGDRKNQAVGEIANAVKDLIGTLAEFQKPLVAIVNGAAYGLGLTILNHADITLATSNASFCMPYSRLGYMPEGGATLTLPQAVGTTIAMDLILRGQAITAEQARDIGLINEVCEVRRLPQDLVSRVQKMAENSLPGMEATKAMIKMRLHTQLPLVLETEAKLLPQMWLSPGCQEAIQSALNSGFFEDC